MSGLVLFLVFSASIKRAAIDAKIQDSNAIADLVENQVLRAESSEKLWENVRSVCGARSGLKLVLYGAGGKVLGGCGANPALEAPSRSDTTRRVRVVAEDWPWVLFHETSVVTDLTGSFPHGVQSARLFMDIPSSVFAPAWKFFAAYLGAYPIVPFPARIHPVPQDCHRTGQGRGATGGESLGPGGR